MSIIYQDGYVGGLYPRDVPSGLPDVNSTDNDVTNDVIGNKNDQSFSGYQFHPSVIGHLKAIYYHAHGQSFCLPDNAPVEIAPAGTTAYVYGTPVLVGTYNESVFDVHWVQVTDINNNGYYNIQLCNVDGTTVYGKTFCSRTTNFNMEGNVPIQVPPLLKGTSVYARVGYSGTNAGHTVKVKLFCHPYNDLKS